MTNRREAAVVNQHETIYRSINAMKAYMDFVMGSFEDLPLNEVEDIGKKVVHHSRIIEGVLTSA